MRLAAQDRLGSDDEIAHVLLGVKGLHPTAIRFLVPLLWVVIAATVVLAPGRWAAPIALIAFVLAQFVAKRACRALVFAFVARGIVVLGVDAKSNGKIKVSEPVGMLPAEERRRLPATAGTWTRSDFAGGTWFHRSMAATIDAVLDPEAGLPGGFTVRWRDADGTPADPGRAPGHGSTSP